MGHGMWVGRPCPPVRNDIVTPRHLFLFTSVCICYYFSTLKVCTEIMRKCGVAIEINSAKDQSLTLMITGKASFIISNGFIRRYEISRPSCTTDVFSLFCTLIDIHFKAKLRMCYKHGRRSPRSCRRSATSAWPFRR